MASSPKIKICKVCNYKLVGDEYNLLIACSLCKVIHERYDNLLDKHDNVSIMLSNVHQEGRLHECMHYFSVKSVYDKVVIPFLGRSCVNDDMLIGFHRLNLSSSQTIKHEFYTILLRPTTFSYE